MNKQEYMNQLKKRLRRLPKEDFTRAAEYFEEYFAEAGAEHEAEAIQDLGTPQEAADQIIQSIALDYSKEPVTNMKKGLHALWVVFLALCAAPLALPLLLAGVLLILTAVLLVLTLMLAMLLVSACGVLTGPVTFIAGFTVLTKSIPVFLTCIGMGLMSTGTGLALTYGMVLLCRHFLGWILQVCGNIFQRQKKVKKI